MIIRHRPTLWVIFRTWLFLGIQSFGGGSATFLLIHQACIEREWLDEEEFVRSWAISQIAPGINLVKLTVLIGYKLRGWSGVFMAISGLLLPSALVTVLMTAGFSLIQHQPTIQAAMRGVLPATIGLSLAMGVKMGQPLMRRSFQEGIGRIGVSVFILISSGLLMVIGNVSPLIILILAGVGAMILLPIFQVQGKEKLPVKEEAL